MPRRRAGSSSAGAGIGSGKLSTHAGGETEGMDRQTLRDWVHRYNDLGVDGLKSRHGPGPAPAPTEQQMAALKALVIKGPDPATNKVVRWHALICARKSRAGSTSRCRRARSANGHTRAG